MRRILFFLLLLSALTRCKTPEMHPEMEEFIRQFEGKKIAVLKEEVQKELSNVLSLTPLISNDMGEYQKNTAKIDEKYVAPFTIDTSLVAQALTQFEFITFKQQFKQYESFLSFEQKDARYWSPLSLPEVMQEQHQAMAVFYRDKAPLRDSLPFKLRFSRESAWGKMAVIDSIQFQYTLRYPTQVDSLHLGGETTEVAYQGDKITLLAQHDNFIHLKIPNRHNDALVILGFNEEGKPLAIQASTQGQRTPEAQQEALAQIQQFYKEFSRKLQDNSLNDSIALKRYLRRRVPQLKGLRTSDYSHRMLYFRGNVAKVGLYFISKYTEKTTPFTAVRSTQFGEIIHMPTAEGNLFLSAKLDPLFSVDSVRVSVLKERFFYGDNHYYYLDERRQQLIPVEAEELVEFKNGLAVMRKKNTETFRLLNNENQQISALKISRYEALNSQLIAIYDEQNKAYIVNKAGVIRFLPMVKQLNPMRDGMILVQHTDERYGFLDETGRQVIPFKYHVAMDFSGGLAAVKKVGEQRYGYIDKNAKLVLPYRYTRASNFINDLAFVSTNDSLFLISPQGKAKVKAPIQTWGISGLGINRVYQFGEAFYNSRGEQLSKNN